MAAVQTIFYLFYPMALLFGCRTEEISSYQLAVGRELQ